VALPNSFLTETNLICLVCPDRETAARRCVEELGIGPWEFYDFVPPGQKDDMIGGKPVPYTMRVAFAEVGAVGWAFLEPLTGPTIYAEFLARKGAGVHHAAFEHDGLDYDGAVGEFARRGLAVAQSGFFGGRYCYFPTREAAHIIFELVDAAGGEMPEPVGRFPEGSGTMPPGFVQTASLGLVCANLDETVKVYADQLGIGPWEIADDGDGAGRRASARVGGFGWEIVEPGAGASAYAEFLERRGPGVHHIGVTAAPGEYGARRAALAQQGFAVVGEEAGASIFATDDVLGARLKLIDA
jgi:methylmalonyl-CoA/ethylmalonyl-CoA epimerase